MLIHFPIRDIEKPQVTYYLGVQINALDEFCSFRLNTEGVINIGTPKFPDGRCDLNEHTM
jgi:hypothetical protein